MGIAFLFPGQGSQHIGMGQGLHAQFDAARQVYVEASDVLGWDVGKLCFEGPEAQLNQTAYTQPALLVTSIAAWRSLGAPIEAASVLAGHSLGEYTALVAADALSFSDAVRIVHLRGRFMQEAVQEGKGAMAAIIGLTREIIDRVCKDVTTSFGKVSSANYNAPGQVVISGEKESVLKAMEQARNAGAKRTIQLAVSVPSHSPLMQPACLRLSDELDKIDGKNLQVPLINNLSAKEVYSWPDAKAGLVDQLSSPLLWEETIQEMQMKKVDLFVEVGPGRILSGLMKRIDRRANTMNVADPAGVEKVQTHLKPEHS
ncbi:MAG: ACP S-malonyltransferase [Nitrospiria bacterium]